MTIHARNRIFISACILGATLLACGGRQTHIPDLESDALPQAALEIDRERELNRLQKEREEELERMLADKTASAERSAELQTAIDKLSKELTSNQQLSADQRKQIEDQLAILKKERENVEAELKRQAQKQAELEKALADAKAANEALQKELAAAKTASQQAPSTGGGTGTTPPPANTTPSRYAFFYMSDCLTIPSNSSTDGVQLFATPCQYGSNQLFTTEAVSTNVVRLVSQVSQKCVYVQGASMTDGAAIQQFTCKRNGDTSEHFEYVGSSTSTDFKLKNVRSGLCLKIATDGKIFQSNCSTNYTMFRYGVVK